MKLLGIIVLVCWFCAIGEAKTSEKAGALASLAAFGSTIALALWAAIS